MTEDNDIGLDTNRAPIYKNHTKVVLCWAGLVILGLIIPVHILKSATRCQERFFTLARCAIM